jgi:hypothetical protein
MGLSVKVKVSTSNVYANGGVSAYTGTWLDINNGTSYKIGKGSFEESSTTFRRDEISSPFVEGKFTVNALRENVSEKLSVHVFGADTIAVQNNVTALINAVKSNQFLIQVTVGNAQQIWLCFASDYSVNTQLEYLHARRALVNVTVTRYPTVILSTDNTVTTGA